MSKQNEWYYDKTMKQSMKIHKPDLSQELQKGLKKICLEIFEIVKQKDPKIRYIVIHYKNDIISVGREVSGCYRHNYYDPDKNDNDSIKNIINNNNDIILRIFDEILKDYPKYTSYNIFYVEKEKSIYVCANKIGVVSKLRCMLFNKISCEDVSKTETNNGTKNRIKKV